ncbi:MAG: hypothetical protein HQL90_08555 [Magnetococcales bacterium]|nr:hypothetical protein [Magnetococcales bacterium]
MTTKGQSRGAATLFMSLIILLSLTVIAVTGGKSARMEQMVSANEYRALEAFHSAEAGLEYGIRWLATITPTWVAGSCNQNMTLTAPALTASNGDSYNQTVSFCRNTATKDYVRVRATSVAVQDPTITASVQQYVRPNTILSPGFALNTPPLVVNGCVNGITGTPDVYAGGVGSLGLATSQTNTPACIDTGHLDLHGGTVLGNAFNTTAWTYLFGSITKAQFQAMAAAEAAAEAAGQMLRSERHYFWITDTNNWHENVGTPTHAVVLAFATASSCAKTNGGVTIYGVVYYEDPSCGNQGWGGADIFGTASFEGNLTQFTANADVNKFTLAGGGKGMDETLPYIGAPKILGTWKDF